MREALGLAHLTVRLGGAAIIRDASASFQAGLVHAVVGRSGAGKSVLMKAAAGLLPRETGEVRLGAPPLVFVHQDPALLDTLTVRENVSFAVARVKGLSRADARARVEQALVRFGLGEVAEREPESLPVATQKRAALARATCLQPGVLIVDEPTTGLDPAAAAFVDEALALLPSAGTTLIVITHSPRTVATLRPRLHLVEDGRLEAAA
ncbi:MAG: ABC transporter ATP-binding protein [Deltaproteobacteria bacterium]|nr:ABC transporter ATP-binding protein [Deltaproteobacteria bacterium]